MRGGLCIAVIEKECLATHATLTHCNMTVKHCSIVRNTASYNITKSQSPSNSCCMYVAHYVQNP